jgi:parvulin-like peptidyl-prolyl isomerase
MGWRVTVSVAATFVFLIAAVIWVFFYAGGFSAYQNVAVLTIGVLAFIGLMGATWASWGLRQESRMGGTGTS